MSKKIYNKRQKIMKYKTLSITHGCWKYLCGWEWDVNRYVRTKWNSKSGGNSILLNECLQAI